MYNYKYYLFTIWNTDYKDRGYGLFLRICIKTYNRFGYSTVRRFSVHKYYPFTGSIYIDMDKFFTLEIASQEKTIYFYDNNRYGFKYDGCVSNKEIEKLINQLRIKK